MAHSLALPRGRPRAVADVAEYTAVSAKVVEVIPGAKVGLANFGADGNAVGWDEHVFPMVKGIVDTKAQVDFIALSCCEGVSWTVFVGSLRTFMRTRIGGRLADDSLMTRLLPSSHLDPHLVLTDLI